ncbi:hypothetical protein CKF48_22270 [Cytobacillus kochii]|uniref:Thioesterase domain-containing protein n=2 Tax=Bacillaceae TaxID=186817 RepID=A0A248TNX0_9BACI|nr:hypothetical protein CKF48_22270 [Cytobacillus kochii]
MNGEVSIMKNEYLQWLEKEFNTSPYWQLLGITMDELEAGRARIKMSVQKQHLNSNGVVHGGATASLLDSVIGVTIRSMKDVKVATISLTTQFLAPVKEGILYAEAKMIHEGRRIQYVESILTQEDGSVVAKALGTFSIKQRIS